VDAAGNFETVVMTSSLDNETPCLMTIYKTARRHISEEEAHRSRNLKWRVNIMSRNVFIRN